MQWVFYALGAISAVAVSDILRKLGSNLKDPYFSNLIFQLGSITMAIALWFFFSRRFEYDNQALWYALAGGVLVSLFTMLTFKSLEIGPGVSTVMPFIRIGGVLLVAVLGILLLKDKLTWSLAAGLLLALAGVYLIFSGK